MITWIKDTDLFNCLSDYDIILVGTNLYWTMSQGLQLQVMLNYPYVFNKNQSTKYGDVEKLGTILECSSPNQPTFCLCFICEGYNFRPDLKTEYISYEALEKCLKLVNIKYKGKKIASPLLGYSQFEGNGKRDVITDIYNRCLSDVDITIFDYEQKSRADMVKIMYLKEQEVKYKDREKYYQMVAERKRQAEERFKKNGHRRY